MWKKKKSGKKLRKENFETFECDSRNRLKRFICATCKLLDDVAYNIMVFCRLPQKQTLDSLGMEQNQPLKALNTRPKMTPKQKVGLQ